MLKIRLSGTENEIRSGVEKIKTIYNVIYESGAYPDRNGKTCRIYLDVKENVEENKNGKTD